MQFSYLNQFGVHIQFFFSYSSCIILENEKVYFFSLDFLSRKQFYLYYDVSTNLFKIFMKLHLMPITEKIYNKTVKTKMKIPITFL